MAEKILYILLRRLKTTTIFSGEITPSDPDAEARFSYRYAG
jgi:hypothetical protein